MGCRIDSPFFMVCEGKMLSIIGNWVYIALLTSAMGFALMQGYTVLFAKLNKQKASRDYGFMHVLLAGILGTTIYAQVFSLFYRVNIEAKDRKSVV